MAKSRKQKNGKRNATRNANANANIVRKNYEEMKKMAHNKVFWGDAMLADNAKRPPRSRSLKAVSRGPAEQFEMNAVENWNIPNLTMRKGIWENFPVVMEELPDEDDGKKRFAVIWHRKNLAEWREKRAASYAEWAEYEAITKARLLHALRSHSRIYTIEPPRAPEQIVVLNVGHRAASPSRAAPAHAHAKRAASPPRAGVPVLAKLMDIKAHFPNVIWNKVDNGAPGETTYAIIIKGDYARRVPAAELVSFKNALENALSASRFWFTLPPAAANEFKRIQMRHD